MMRNALRAVGLTLLLCLPFFMLFTTQTVLPFISFTRRAYLSQIKTVKLIVTKEKTKDEVAYIRRSLQTSRKQTVFVSRIAHQLAKPFLFTNIDRPVQFLDSLALMSTHLDELLGKTKETSYLLFFLNNYELRPGGGFIGSVGKMTFENYTLKQFDIEDVYEIDGQVTEHNEPHYAVRNYLNQPNEFLRDSNFSPDFKTNVQKSLSYLRTVPKFNVEYNGAVGITTSAFEEFLNVTGPLYLSDYRDTVTADNFFEKTQSAIETTFFPGSDQKKNILQSLGNLTLTKIERIPPYQFLRFVYDSLRSKNIVVYAKTRQLQELFDSLGWTGSQRLDLYDYLFPINTNVGVNKANKFIDTKLQIQIIRRPPVLKRVVNVTYINSAVSDSKLGGAYHDYFQLYVPKDTVLTELTIDAVSFLNVVRVTEEHGYKIFGLYLEVPPSSKKTIQFAYESKNDLPYDFPYKLAVQKQIGAKKDPVLFIYSTPEKTTTRETVLNEDLMLSF